MSLLQDWQKVGFINFRGQTFGPTVECVIVKIQIITGHGPHVQIQAAAAQNSNVMTHLQAN